MGIKGSAHMLATDVAVSDFLIFLAFYAATATWMVYELSGPRKIVATEDSSALRAEIISVISGAPGRTFKASQLELDRAGTSTLGIRWHPTLPIFHE
jgi:hypothetical protein